MIKQALCVSFPVQYNLYMYLKGLKKIKNIARSPRQMYKIYNII